jgi:MFS superfamily sulfate permease-like transporter
MLGLAAMLSHPEAKTEPPNSPLEKLLFVIHHIDHTNKTTMTLALASLAFLIFVRSIKPRLVNRPGAKWVRFVPEILLAVVIGTGKSIHRLANWSSWLFKPLPVSSGWTREEWIFSERSKQAMALP